MMNRTAAFALLLTSLVSAPVTVQAAEDPRLNALLDELDDMWRGASSHAEIKMQVKTANYERSMKMESWSQGKERSLVRIVAPIKEKGTATLKSGDSLYTYLPKTDRTIRLTGAMMSGSWMGSHLTNDDLVRESRFRDDFDAKISFEGEREGRKTIEITGIPKPDAAIVWGKVTIELDAVTRQAIRYRYFDEDMKPTRTMSFHEPKDFGGGRVMPSRMRVEPADKPAEFTEIVYESLQLDVTLDDAMFSIARLRKSR